MTRPYLRKMREERQLTLLQVATAIDISPSYLARIENGRHNPSWRVALRLERFFNINASELLKRDGDDN